MFDTHVHTFFSKDSRSSPESICEAAVEKGLEGITITDHLDYDFPGYTESSYIDFDSYFGYLTKLAARYASALKVLKGVEVGIQPHVIEKILEVVRRYTFDYVIASVHIIEGLDPYQGSYYEGKTKQEAYGRYLEEVLFAVERFPDFDVAGHLDYIIRYAPYSDRSMRYSDHPDLFDTIFKKLILSGRGLEVNTSSYRKNRGTGTPVGNGGGTGANDAHNRVPVFDVDILKRYRELGGEIVCLGSDSHSPEYVAYGFGEFLDFLRQAGFRYVAHFEERRPVFEAI